MPDIVIVDSNILLNVLDVPAHNQDREAVFTEFEILVEAGDHLLLPMAAVLETADHIADLSDGRERRRFAIRFRDRILEALRDDAPWALIEFPEASCLAEWLEDFPDNAARELGLSDVSIVRRLANSVRPAPESARIRLDASSTTPSVRPPTLGSDCGAVDFHDARSRRRLRVARTPRRQQRAEYPPAFNRARWERSFAASPFDFEHQGGAAFDLDGAGQLEASTAYHVGPDDGVGRAKHFAEPFSV